MEGVDWLICVGVIDDIYGIFEYLEDVVYKVCIGGLFGFGVKDYCKAREDWLELGGTVLY